MSWVVNATQFLTSLFNTQSILTRLNRWSACDVRLRFVQMPLRLTRLRNFAVDAARQVCIPRYLRCNINKQTVQINLSRIKRNSVMWKLETIESLLWDSYQVKRTVWIYLLYLRYLGEIPNSPDNIMASSVHVYYIWQFL